MSRKKCSCFRIVLIDVFTLLSLFLLLSPLSYNDSPVFSSPKQKVRLLLFFFFFFCFPPYSTNTHTHVPAENEEKSGLRTASMTKIERERENTVITLSVLLV